MNASSEKYFFVESYSCGMVFLPNTVTLNSKGVWRGNYEQGFFPYEEKSVKHQIA